MSRNVTLQIVRGVKANMPALAVGEYYFCTDTFEHFIGSSTGNFPLGIPVYNSSGARQLKPHVVIDNVTLPSGGSATVTLSGSAGFASASSYVVIASDNIAKRTLNIVRNSGTSFTVSGGGTGDIVSYICIGN